MPDDRRLIDYLLDSLPEREAERLDELSVIDDDFAVELLRIEHDLVDAYVSGELSGEDVTRFRTHYLDKPGAAERVRFAELWRAHRAQSPVETRRVAHTVRGIAHRPFPRGWLTLWGLAAAALFMLVATGYLVVQNVHLRRLIDAAHSDRIAIEQRAQQLTRELESERGAHADTLKQLQDTRVAPTAPTADTTSKSSLPAIIATTVLPPPSRGVSETGGASGIGERPTVAIPRGSVGDVEVHLQLESDDFARYRVELTSEQGAGALWRSGSLRATSRGGTRVVTVRVPARVLAPRVYHLDLTGLSARRSDQIANYVLRVVFTS